MNKSKKSIGEKLNALSGSKSSNLPQKTKEKHENSFWLKRSAYIAFQLMDALDAKGMTQKDLARILNVSQQQVGKWLQGQENMKLDTITRLEDALDIEIDISRNSIDKLCYPEVTLQIQTTNILHISVADISQKTRLQVKREVSTGIDLHFEGIMDLSKRPYSYAECLEIDETLS